MDVVAPVPRGSPQEREEPALPGRIPGRGTRGIDLDLDPAPPGETMGGSRVARIFARARALEGNLGGARITGHDGSDHGDPGGTPGL